MLRTLAFFVVTCSLLSCKKDNQENQAEQKLPKVDFSDTPWLGIELMENDKSLTVRKVIDGSPAAVAGVQQDDILVSLNASEVSNIESVHTILEKISTKKISLIVTRTGMQQTLTLRPSKMLLIEDGVVSWGDGRCDKNCNCDGNDSTQCVSIYRYIGPRKGGGSTFAKYCTDERTTFVNSCYFVTLI